MLAMSVVATMLFITEPVPLPTVPLLIIVGEVVLLGVDPTKVAQSLMTDSVLFIMGSLMLAVAIVKQRLDKRIAWWIVRMTGTNVYWISFGITAVCGVLAAFIGEHTVAAMMLPVGVTLITLTSNDPKKVRNLAAVILFSISYGCSIAGVATPSGGARNAIIISYWKDFFYDPADPATRRYPHGLRDVDHLRLPDVPAAAADRHGAADGDLQARDDRHVAAGGAAAHPGHDGGTAQAFGLADHRDLRPDHPRLGVPLRTARTWASIALIGVCAFLVLGLVRWEDINSGVNWGVVLLYAAAISLGVEMKATGAAEWLAQSVLSILA